MWWVATAPEARGRGLASGLMRRALADGRERGNDISTLQATKMGRPVYEGLGYRAFGVSRCGSGARPRRGRSAQLDLLLEHDLALERAVHGALGDDLHQPLALLLRQLLRQLHRQLEAWWASRAGRARSPPPPTTSPMSQPLRSAYISMVIALQEARLAASSSCGLGPESVAAGACAARRR